ncbi:hypothetical protein MHH81_21110 [Psychrobacillus sp. FSL H8-0484]|uniref:hypothetical protein n=1 Tax=Psychrobacillus sp. FSL H8-0484 TaxID=2921390 RepID=UPI0030F76549
MHYITSKNGFWSKEQGWVLDISLASAFVEEQKQHTRLPLGDSVKWCFLPYRMTYLDMREQRTQIVVQQGNEDIAQTLSKVLNSEFRMYTPAGLMTVSRCDDVEYPGVKVEIDGNGGAAIEWDSTKQSIRVHVYPPDKEEPLSIDLDYFTQREFQL